MNRKTEEIINAKHILTQEEKVAIASEIGEIYENIKSFESDLEGAKETTKEIKSQIEAEEIKIRDRAVQIKNGYVYRDVECKIDYNWAEKKKYWFSKEGHEFIKEEDIPEEEFQEEAELVNQNYEG